MRQGVHISVVEARARLSRWLKRLEDEFIIARRGKPIGILIAPEEYEELRRVQVYLQMLPLCRSPAGSGVTADELLLASREKSEERG